jgi:hypothetical protein
MAIKYIDWDNGVDNDAVNDGSADEPWKSIDYATASARCSPGDEVRCAKSTITAISGSWTFTDGDASVTCSGDKTGEVSSGDIIGNDDIEYWRVSTVNYASGTTTIELTCNFCGTNGVYSIGNVYCFDTAGVGHLPMGMLL